MLNFQKVEERSKRLADLQILNERKNIYNQQIRQQEKFRKKPKLVKVNQYEEENSNQFRLDNGKGMSELKFDTEKWCNFENIVRMHDEALQNKKLNHQYMKDLCNLLKRKDINYIQKKEKLNNPFTLKNKNPTISISQRLSLKFDKVNLDEGNILSRNKLNFNKTTFSHSNFNNYAYEDSDDEGIDPNISKKNVMMPPVIINKIDSVGNEIKNANAEDYNLHLDTSVDDLNSKQKLKIFKKLHDHYNFIKIPKNSFRRFDNSPYKKISRNSSTISRAKIFDINQEINDNKTLSNFIKNRTKQPKSKKIEYYVEDDLAEIKNKKILAENILRKIIY